MADDDNQVPQSAPEPPTPQQIEEHLGSFDFDGPTPPQQREAREAPPPQQEATAPQEPQEQEPQEQPPLTPPDPEIEWNNRKWKMSQVQRSLADYQARVNDFQRRQQAFQQQTQGFTQYQQQAAEMLQRAVQMVEQYMPRKPSPELAKTDPLAYQEQRVTWEAAMEKLDEAKNNHNNFVQQAQAQQRWRQQQHLVQQANTVLQKMPELRDPVRFAKWAEELKSLAVAHNYQISDLSYVRDARLIGIFNEAMEGRRMKAANESLKAKIKAQQVARPAPPAQQPQRRRSTATVQADNMRAALTRLRNNPASQQAAEDVLSRFD